MDNHRTSDGARSGLVLRSTSKSKKKKKKKKKKTPTYPCDITKPTQVLPSTSPQQQRSVPTQEAMYRQRNPSADPCNGRKPWAGWGLRRINQRRQARVGGRGREFQIQEEKIKDSLEKRNSPKRNKNTKLEHEQKKEKKGRKKERKKKEDTHFPCIGSQIHATG